MFFVHYDFPLCIHRMDDILSEFISHTNADPALAHDLLEATGWELEVALSAFEGLKDTHAVLPDDEFDFDPSKF